MKARPWTRWRPGTRSAPGPRRRITTLHPAPEDPAPPSPASDTPKLGLAEAEALQDDDEAPETGPLRRCIVTRQREYRVRMVRFVVGPERVIVPDLLARLPGRGIWLSARRDVVETARSRGGFARAAKAQVVVPTDLADLVEAGLVRRVTELLGLARRAGQAVCGFQKARDWLLAKRVALVVQASDGSPEERARFLSGVRDMQVASPLGAVALGAVFGRDHAVHAAIAHGRLAEALAIETTRLAGMAGQPEMSRKLPGGTATGPG